jgi:hypothetical protein
MSSPAGVPDRNPVDYAPGRAARYVLLDTATMPIEDVPGNPGARRRTLLDVADAPGFVRIVYGPAGFADNVRALLAHGPHRHYHRSVTERHYVLGGDYPIWHWLDATPGGQLTRLHRHHYLENPPGTLHGIMPGSLPDTGYSILHWTNGRGTELFEPGADVETFTVPPDATVNPAALRAPILVHAEDIAWSAHRRLPQWKTRPLGAATGSCPVALLVNVPPATDTGAGVAALAGPGWLWLLVISGDLRLQASDAAGTKPLSLREGSFLAWSPGSSVTLERETPSRGGCVCLCVGHDLAGAA